MENIPQFVPQNVCLSCDGCCRFKEQDSEWRPKMTQDEIKQNGGLAEEIFSNEMDDKGYVKAVKCGGQVKCTFFHLKDNICRIYEQRPYECRLYPFLLIKEGDGAVSIGVHLSCPYIQDKWAKEEFDAHVGKLKEYFQREDVLSFIRNNQTLLGEYESYKDEIAHVFPLDF